MDNNRISGTIVVVSLPQLHPGSITRALRGYGLNITLKAVKEPYKALEIMQALPPLAVIIPEKARGIIFEEFVSRLRELTGDIPVFVIRDRIQAENIKLNNIYSIPGKLIKDTTALSYVIAMVLIQSIKEQNKRKKQDLIIESRRQWMAIMDAITDYIYVIDNDYNIIKTNLALVEYLNKSPREVIEKKCYEVFKCQMKNTCPKEVVTSTRKPYTYEKQKEGRMYQITVYPLLEEDQVYTVHYMKDVTEIKRLKEHLYYTDKLTSLGQLVSGVAHEINNPLTGVIAFTEMLISRTEDEETRQILKKVLHSADRCKRIVENLLTFSKQRKPLKSLESINSIIERTIELRNYWLRKNNIKIITQLGEIPSVFIDPQQIQEVILNILINAEQAIVLNNIQNGQITITTGYNPETRRVVIRIADNATGIPEHLLKKIFEPFFTTKPVGIGTGLGLSISHSIITEHGGTIWAENSPEGGAVFTIEIPTSQESIKRG